MKCFVLLPFVSVVSASVLASDPSDTISGSQWAADNAIKADYNVPVIYYQTIANVGPNIVNNSQHKTYNKVTLEAGGNDTSVLIATGGSVVDLEYSAILKYGYSSDLIQASFFGVNSAVLAANASQLYITSTNVTTHNGAANIYAYGSGTAIEIDDAWLYSSGPTSHGLYASGNGTIHAKNVRHFSGGNRCSSFSGDNPAGYLYIHDSVAHTSGIGSAVGFVLGEMNLTNVVGAADNSPAFFSIGDAVGSTSHSEFTAGLLAGLVIFSLDKTSGVNYFYLDHTKVTVTEKSAPGLWFGGVIAEAYLDNTEFITESGILAVSNYSTITQEFNFYAGYDDDPSAINSADARVFVQQSALSGDIVAYNGSTLGFSFSDNSFWSGKGYIGHGYAELGVFLDASSTWNVTGDTTLLNITNADKTFSNVWDNGFSITYNASAPANKALGGRSIKLQGGGKLVPAGKK